MASSILQRSVAPAQHLYSQLESHDSMLRNTIEVKKCHRTKRTLEDPAHGAVFPNRLDAAGMGPLTFRAPCHVPVIFWASNALPGNAERANIDSSSLCMREFLAKHFIRSCGFRGANPADEEPFFPRDPTKRGH